MKTMAASLIVSLILCIFNMLAHAKEELVDQPGKIDHPPGESYQPVLLYTVCLNPDDKTGALPVCYKPQVLLPANMV